MSIQTDTIEDENFETIIDQLIEYIGLDKSQNKDFCLDLVNMHYNLRGEEVNEEQFYRIVKDMIKKYLTFYKENYSIIEVEEKMTYKTKRLQRR